MKYGYVRSATQIERELNNQTETLKGYGVEEIIVERSGRDLDDLLTRLQEGDEVHVISICRISRDHSTFLEKWETIKNAGGKLFVENQLFETLLF